MSVGAVALSGWQMVSHLAQIAKVAEVGGKLMVWVRGCFLRRRRGQTLRFLSTVDPPDTCFIGRDADIDRLRNALSYSSIVIVHGAGGCGKSELVKQYVSMCNKSYPGGCFQVDASGLKDWESILRGVKRRSTANGIPASTIVGFNRVPEGDWGYTLNDSCEEWRAIRDGLLRTAGRQGSVLLFLDNIENTENIFSSDSLRAIFQSSYNNTGGVKIVATARHVSSLIDDNVEDIPLQDLTMEHALKIIQASCRNSLSVKEMDSAKRIIELVGCRALYVRRIPALVDNDYSETAYASFQDIEQDLNLHKDEIVGMLGAEEYAPRRLWELTKSQLEKNTPNGKKCIQLAGMIASLPINGVRDDIVCWLWARIVEKQTRMRLDRRPADLQRAIEILKRYHVLFSLDTLRMHALDRDAIYNGIRSDDPMFMDRVAQELIQYIGIEDRFWFYMSDRAEIVRRIDIGKVSGKLAVMLIGMDKDFADGFDWTKLIGSDWVRLLRCHPEYASRCTWEGINPDGWARLLSAQPQFAAHCTFSGFTGTNWATLISAQVGFLQNVDKRLLGPKEWAAIVATQPGCFKLCPRQKMTRSFYSRLICVRPEFFKKAPMAEFLGSDWARMLMAQPHLAKYCNWHKFKTSDIIRLLSVRPEFDEHFDFSKFTSKNWNKFIRKRPDMLKHCNRVVIKKDTWAYLVGLDEKYMDACRDIDFSSKDWIRIILNNPKLADLCPWEIFDGSTWVKLLLVKPRYAYKCDFSKMSAEDCALLVDGDPRFADYIVSMMSSENKGCGCAG